MVFQKRSLYLFAFLLNRYPPTLNHSSAVDSPCDFNLSRQIDKKQGCLGGKRVFFDLKCTSLIQPNASTSSVPFNLEIVVFVTSSAPFEEYLSEKGEVYLCVARTAALTADK